MKNKDTIRNLEYEITTKEQIIKEHEEKVTNLENLIQDLVKKKEQDMSLSHKKVKDNMVKQRKICHVGGVRVRKIQIHKIINGKITKLPIVTTTAMK
ncbi:hypothetical protein RhiirB3_527260 [Rhizophagus irregularis]|nr:hypothetical protein RhiirB3_527260 [Rhizophagus irregularis]